METIYFRLVNKRILYFKFHLANLSTYSKDATNSLFLNNAQASQNSSNSPKIYTKEMIMEMIKKRKESL